MRELFVAISDTHVSLKNLEVSKRVLTQALNKARDLSVPLFIGGDLRDTKAIIRGEEINMLNTLFSENNDVRVLLMVGNHDLMNKNSDAHSLEFLRHHSNITIIDGPLVLDTEGGIGRFYCIPYKKTKEEFQREINKAKENGFTRILGHQGVQGAKMGDYVVDESSICPKELESFEFIGLGHYHKSQDLGNVRYWGSPFTVNFGESSDRKCFWVVNEDDNNKIQLEPIPTDVRHHRQMVVLEGYKSHEDWPDYNEGDPIKVILKGAKEFALRSHEKQFKKLYPNNPITFVPEIDRQSNVRVSQEIIHKPVEVIKNYLESAETSFNKEELYNFLMNNLISDVISGLSSKSNKDIRVINVKAQNFLSYPIMEYAYTPKGLTLVEGYDEDNAISTGAGKSSFLDAVSYVLFGETSKKIKADEVINFTAKKNLSVILTIEIDGKVLNIHRYRKHKEYDNDIYIQFAGNERQIRGKDNRETQKMLIDLLGFDHDMFLRSTYFTQFGDIDKFLSASDTEKKRVISEISDTEVYDEIVNVIKDRIKEYQKESDASHQSMLQVEAAITNQRENYYSIQDSQSSFMLKKKETIETYLNNFRAWEKDHGEELCRLETLSNTFEETKANEIKAAEFGHNDFELKRKHRLAKAQNDIDMWDTQEASDVANIQDNINNKAKELEEFCAQIVRPEKPDFQQEIDQTNKQLEIVSKLEVELDKVGKDLHLCDNKIREEDEDASWTLNRSTLSTCNFCYQPISKDIIDKQHKIKLEKIAELKADREKIAAKYKEISDGVALRPKLEGIINDCNNRTQQYDLLILEYNNQLEKKKFLSTDLSSLQELLLNRQGNPYLNNIDSIEQEINPFLSQVGLLRQKQNIYIQQIEDHKNKENPWSDRIKEAETQENPHDEPLKEALNKLDTLNKELKDILAVKRSIDHKIDLSIWWRDAFHVYIKSYLTDSFIEQLNEYANQKLVDIFDGILSLEVSATSDDKKKTKEKISVTIYKENQKYSYHALSGGERCRICLALNLSIAKITNINLGFIMFDEILNGLDVVGKNQVMKVLQELEKDYATVFVIDHTEEFKNLFSNSIMVRKSNGQSSIVNN